MSGSNRYVLDANVFIEAKNKYYGFNLCPGFWEALIDQHMNSRVCSIDKVLEELAGKNDPLSDWTKATVPDTFFKKTQDQAVIDAFQETITWVNSEEQFKPGAKTEFASVADGWLIALTKVNGLIVVTHEVYAPAAEKNVPMPNVCLEFNVDCVNPAFPG